MLWSLSGSGGKCPLSASFPCFHASPAEMRLGLAGITGALRSPGRRATKVPDCVKRSVSHRSQLLLGGGAEIHNSGKIEAFLLFSLAVLPSWYF